jgi:hypothetical protein
MDWDEDFISFAMDTNAIVKVLVFVVGCELHVDVLAYAGGDHSFLVVLNFEIWSLWR